MDVILASLPTNIRSISSPAPAKVSTPIDPAAEANHRIANTLALLAGLVRMQRASVKKQIRPYSNEDICHLLDGVAARIGTISQIHRILSRGHGEGAVSVQPHLKEITEVLVGALSSPEQQVRVMHLGDDCLVLMRHVQPIVLILCEIFINAVKYAHPTGVPLIMLVDCEPALDGRLVLTVSDDGVGLPDGFLPERDGGMGFKVMRRLADEIGGELQIQSTRLGLSLRLSLPAGTMAGAKLA